MTADTEPRSEIVTVRVQREAIDIRAVDFARQWNDALAGGPWPRGRRCDNGALIVFQPLQIIYAAPVHA